MQGRQTPYCSSDPTSTSSKYCQSILLLYPIFLTVGATFSMNWYGHCNAYDGPRRTRRSLLRSPSPTVSPPEADLLPPRPGIPDSRLSPDSCLGGPRLRQPAHGNRIERPPLHAGGGTGNPHVDPAPYLGFDNCLQTEGASSRRQKSGRCPQPS